MTDVQGEDQRLAIAISVLEVVLQDELVADRHVGDAVEPLLAELTEARQMTQVRTGASGFDIGLSDDSHGVRTSQKATLDEVAVLGLIQAAAGQQTRADRAFVFGCSSVGGGDPQDSS